jgi:hypothetical protein
MAAAFLLDHVGHAVPDRNKNFSKAVLGWLCPADRCWDLLAEPVCREEKFGAAPTGIGKAVGRTRNG